MILEVYVEPLTSSGSRLGFRYGDEPRADSSSLRPRADYGVHYEGVDLAVPGDVYEPDQPIFVVVGAYPAEAILALPVVIEELVIERFGVQGV